jgi:hypothetical protein
MAAQTNGLIGEATMAGEGQFLSEVAVDHGKQLWDGHVKHHEATTIKSSHVS